MTPADFSRPPMDWSRPIRTVASKVVLVELTIWVAEALLKDHQEPGRWTTANVPPRSFAETHHCRLRMNVLEPAERVIHLGFATTTSPWNSTQSLERKWSTPIIDNQWTTNYQHEWFHWFDWLNRACQVCTPNATNTVWSHCQCVLADGVERGILTANRMIPGPSIQVCEGDKVVVDVENHMQGMEATLHWHGIWQKGSQHYDGVPYVTQCPIQEGNTFR